MKRENLNYTMPNLLHPGWKMHIDLNSKGFKIQSRVNKLENILFTTSINFKIVMNLSNLSYMRKTSIQGVNIFSIQLTLVAFINL